MRSAIRQQRMSGSRIRLVQSSSLAQAPLSAAALAGQEMPQVSAFVLYGAALGKLEPLGGAPRGLNFWHN